MEKMFVKPDAIDAFMNEKGLGDQDLATLMDMDRTTVFKARNGSPVGGKFIANLLRVAEGKSFNDLFFSRKPLRGINSKKGA